MNEGIKGVLLAVKNYIARVIFFLARKNHLQFEMNKEQSSSLLNFSNGLRLKSILLMLGILLINSETNETATRIY